MPRNLALNISVGALLDKTVGKVFKEATDSAEELGQQQKELNQQMKKLNAVRRFTDQLEKLKKEAEASGDVTDTLARRIRLTEARLNAASDDARKMGISVNNLGEAEAKLNRELQKNNLALEHRERIDARSERLRGAAGFARQHALKGAIVGGAPIVAGGALLAATTYINQLTAEQANLARAVGLTAKEMDIWAAIVQEAGFDSEKVIDLVEELNNKFGESKGLAEQTTEVKDAMKVLRLDFERMKQLKPADQFKEIVNQTRKIGGQRAVSGADILLGGDANKIIGHLNAMGVPLDQLFQRFEQLYVGSKKGLEGARTFNTAWSELRYTLIQSFKELNGLVGIELAPQMRKWAEELSTWFKQNRDDIGEFSKDLGTTLKALGIGLVNLAISLPKIVSAMTTLSDLVLKWFGPDEEDQKRQQQLQDHEAEQIRRRALRKQQDKAGKRLNRPYAPFDRNAAQKLLEARRLQPEPVAQNLNNPNVPFDQNAAQQLLESRQPSHTATVNQDNRVTFNITQQPGQDGEQLASQIERHIRSVQDDRATADEFSQPEAVA